MSSHLSDQQWAAAILEQSEKATADHLRECAACREELTSFAEALGEARQQIRSATERPESFWRRQREAISAHVAARAFHQPWKRWVWATATVTLILLASTLLSRNSAPPLPVAAQADPDDALLLSVQQSISSDLPQALRPAALLTQEMDRAVQSRRNP